MSAVAVDPLAAAQAAAERRLGRELTTGEVHVDLISLDRALAEGKATLAEAIAAEQSRVAGRIARGYPERMTVSAAMIRALRALREAGRALALAEMRSMGVEPELTFASVDPADPLAPVLGVLQASLRSIDVRIDRRGIEGDLGALSTRAVRRALERVPGALDVASRLVSTTLADGLHDVYEVHRELFPAWQYSAVMDAGTCAECAARDGEIYLSLDEMYLALPNFGPNPLCFGDGRCRCRGVPVPPTVDSAAVLVETDDPELLSFQEEMRLNKDAYDAYVLARKLGASSQELYREGYTAYSRAYKRALARRKELGLGPAPRTPKVKPPVPNAVPSVARTPEEAVEGMLRGIRERDPYASDFDLESARRAWMDRLRDRVAGDSATLEQLRRAVLYNEDSGLHRAALDRIGAETIVPTTPPPGGVIDALLDVNERFAAHRITGSRTTVIRQEAIGVRPGIIRPGDATTSANGGTAAVLRHEFGHTLWDELDEADRRRLVDLLPKSDVRRRNDLTIYAVQNSEEAFCEAYAIVADPAFELSAAWGRWATDFRDDLLRVLGTDPEVEIASLRTALAKTWGGRIHRGPTGEMERALDLIESVHGILPADFTYELAVQVKVLPGGTGGFFGYSPSIGQARYIQVTSKESALGWAHSFVHELGHYLDFQDLGVRPTTTTGFTSKFFPDRMGRVMEAISNSASTSHQRGLRSRGSAAASPAHVKYLLQPEEQFARAYVQWISIRTGDPTLLSQLRRQQTDWYRTHWEDSDFEPIAAALDDLFRDLGLLRES